MKLDRCLENLPDLFAAMESDEAPKDSTTLGDHNDFVEQLNDNVVELNTVPAVRVKAVGVRSHVLVIPHPCCESRKTGKNTDTANGRKPGAAQLRVCCFVLCRCCAVIEECVSFERRRFGESLREE